MNCCWLKKKKKYNFSFIKTASKGIYSAFRVTELIYKETASAYFLKRTLLSHKMRQNPWKTDFLPFCIFLKCSLQYHTPTYVSSLLSFRWITLFKFRVKHYKKSLSYHLPSWLTFQRLFSITPVQLKLLPQKQFNFMIKLLSTFTLGCHFASLKPGSCRSHSSIPIHNEFHLTSQTVPWGPQGLSQFTEEVNVILSFSYWTTCNLLLPFINPRWLI